MPNERADKRPIDERIHRVLTGQADPGDEEAVRRWRATSLDNERSYRAAALILEMERKRMGSIDAGSPPEARDVIWLAEAREAARKLTGQRRHPGGRAWWRAGWALAAALAAAAVGVLLDRPDTVPSTGLQIDTFLTGGDDPVTIRLSDGSIVRLGPGSQLRPMPGSTQRIVELDGRAYFAITSDPNNPFIVRTRAGDARVLGTRFHAQAAGDSMQVLVIEGQVALTGTSQEAKIEAHQVGTIRRGRVEAVASVTDVDPTLDWVGDFIVFQATPLEAAMTEIADKYGMRYEIVDETYARRDLTMWFAGKPVNEVVDVICAVLGAQCSIEADLIRIGG